MAEFAVKIGDSEHYDDKDILCAFNRRRIGCTHMQHLCHKKHAARSGDGLILPGSLTQKMLERVSRSRFERVSKHEVRRVRLATLDAEVFTGPEYVVTIDGESPRHVRYPDEIAVYRSNRRSREKAILIAAEEHGEAALTFTEGRYDLRINGVPRAVMWALVSPEVQYVDEYVARRLAAGKKPMFGTPGREVWYGGKTDHSVAAVDDVWTQIETHSEHRRANYNYWPMSVESPPTEITLSLSPDFRKRLRKLGLPEPFQIQYFGADREYHVGIEGQRVTAIRGGREARDHFFLAVDEFDDATAEDLVAPLRRDSGKTDEFGRTVWAVEKKRKHQVDWRNLPGISAETIAKIEDKRQYVDGRRKSSFERSAIVVAKNLEAVQWQQ
jgi:hypothetical protein